MGKDKKKKLDVGEDSVVMGDVTGSVGNRSVVIGPTDENGNVILNQPMAVGYGATAGPNSIAIGAHASAGSDILHLLNTLKEMPEVQKDESLVSTIEAVSSEIRKPDPDTSRIKTLWNVVVAAGVVGDAVGLVEKISSTFSGI